MKLIQIVPALPPPVGGVASYALALGDALAARHGWSSRYLVGDPGWSEEAEEGRGAAVAARTPDALAERLAESGAPVALLHYAGYGYATRGCPEWLAAGLARWLAGDAGNRRLVTFFHEVYATGPPWRSSFWLAPRQRRVAGRLAELSAATATSLPLYAELLRRAGAASAAAPKPIILPVVSTAGEPREPAALAGREPRLVVFGGTGNRRRAYADHAHELAAICEALDLGAVADVGPGDAGAPRRLGKAAVRRHGTLPAHEVSALLGASMAGFLSYPPGFLPKSTVFASYSAHRLPAFVAWRGADAGESTSGADLWLTPPAGERALPVATLQGVADRAHSWYSRHSLPHQVEAFVGMLSGRTAAASAPPEPPEP